MSHAPAHRKSPRALASATAKTASERPSPHQVVLRIKRKRSDTAVDSLLVATNEEVANNEAGMPDRKRRAGTIEDNLAVLSLSKAVGPEQAVVSPPAPRLYYTRARTTDSAGRVKLEEANAFPGFPGQAAGLDATCSTSVAGEGRHLDALLSKVKGPTTSPAPTVLDYLEVRRVRARGVGGMSRNTDSAGSDGLRASASPGASSAGAAVDVHVIDLKPVRRSDAAGTDVGRAPEGEYNDAGARPAMPVLNPAERQMDEAIFTAFQTGNLSGVREILASSPAIVNYRRRLGDGTTALMAAAFHGDLDSIRYLLSMGAKACFVDAGDKSAALFAGMRGHHQCFAELQCVADEENTLSMQRRGEGGGGRDDFVYDLYYFEPSVPHGVGQEVGEGESMSVDQAGGGLSSPGMSLEKITTTTSSAPVVLLSGIGPVDVNAVGTTAEMDLKFEHDSDWSELGDDDGGEDPDSNSEGFYGNDYPEDEGVDDGTQVPYTYDGSSCPSEDGSSSDGGRLHSDDDVDFPRRILDADGRRNVVDTSMSNRFRAPDGARASPTPSFSRDGGLYLLGKHSPPTDEECVDFSSFQTVELRNAEVFAWDPKRADGEGT